MFPWHEIMSPKQGRTQITHGPVLGGQGRAAQGEVAQSFASA